MIKVSDLHQDHPLGDKSFGGEGVLILAGAFSGRRLCFSGAFIGAYTEAFTGAFTEASTRAFIEAFKGA